MGREAGEGGEYWRWYCGLRIYNKTCFDANDTLPTLGRLWLLLDRSMQRIWTFRSEKPEIEYDGKDSRVFFFLGKEIKSSKHTTPTIPSLMCIFFIVDGIGRPQITAKGKHPLITVWCLWIIQSLLVIISDWKRKRLRNFRIEKWV